MNGQKDIFLDLNPQQILAAKHIDGPALVVAGPGSGKTKLLTHRICNLILNYGVFENNILCVTFTNKAANEIKERVEKLLLKNQHSITKLAWSGTFHSICSKILRKEGYNIGIPSSFVIFDTDDQLNVIKQIFKDFDIDKKHNNPKAVLNTISNAKSELINAQEYQEYAQGYFQKNVAKIYPEYQKRLKKLDALDFDDLLMETVNLFSTNKHILEKYQQIFEYILIDEYQDTNKAQYTIAKLLAQQHENLFVVGDMSQAIYSFRGADYRNILNFQKDYENAKIYNLEKNYRSTQNILDAASNLIKNNSTHIHLNLTTENDNGEKLTIYTGINEHAEAQFVSENILQFVSTQNIQYSDIAVLYRTNAQSRNIEESLIKNNIPYKIVGGFRFYSRKEVKDIISYLRVIHNPKDTISWERIINTPPRKIGKKTVESIKNAGWNIDEIEYKTNLPFTKWIDQKDELATIELMDEIIEKTKYIQWLDDGSEENIQRIENIKELRTVANAFTNLHDFLENVALIESTDKAKYSNDNNVTLMTVHASKGLEFKLIFIVGMEEGLFPHSRSIMELSELEEERRLCYVAITRAKEKVILTKTNQRMYFGRSENNLPSRFLQEIPQDLLEITGYTPKTNPKINEFIDDFLNDELNRQNFNW